MASLKNTTWTVAHQTSGSRGQLKLGGDTTGTYSVGGIPTPVVWGENWVGDYCYLWVLLKSNIDNNIIDIWGFQTTLTSGAGMSARGNANPGNPTDTSFINDQLTMTPQPQ